MLLVVTLINVMLQCIIYGPVDLSIALTFVTKILFMSMDGGVYFWRLSHDKTVSVNENHLNT